MQALCERVPDVTIIIPVYNLEHYITPMLTSLRDQDLGDYTAEIIFVLNNCTDNSRQVIEDSGLDCQIIECTTQGCGPARNAALDIATGNYIWMLDGDDWLTSDFAVATALSKAYAEDLDILYIPFMSNLFHRFYFSMVWQYMIRRTFIGDIRFPNYQPSEDDAFTAAILDKAGCVEGRQMHLPSVGFPLYWYNYMREGSNMYRVSFGEKI